MGFEMNSSPPSKEKTLEKMASIIRIGHDTIQKEHEKLQASCTAIISFGYESPNEDEILPQYKAEKQGYFYTHINRILSASSAINEVINQEKTDMFKLENMVPIDIDPLALTLPPEMPKLKNEEPQNFLSKLLGKKQPKVRKETDPYQLGLDTWKKHKKTEKFIDLFIEYQSYGVRKALKRSSKWMFRYKNFHYGRFQFMIVPAIIRLHRQHIDHKLSLEKKLAVKVATAEVQSIMRQENNPFAGGP